MALKLPAALCPEKKVGLLLERHWVVRGGPEQETVYIHPRNKSHWESAPVLNPPTPVPPSGTHINACLLRTSCSPLLPG